MPNMNKFSGGSAELTGNAVASDVLSGKTFYSNNEEQKLTGTMANKGAITGSVGVGGSYTIPQGYHNGSGKVTGPALSGNASTSQVLSGSTFYSNNGTKQTGTMTNRGAWGATINPGESVSIPGGYHNGSGGITANPFRIAKLRTYNCDLIIRTTQGNLNWPRSQEWSVNMVPKMAQLVVFSDRYTTANSRTESYLDGYINGQWIRLAAVNETASERYSVAFVTNSLEVGTCTKLRITSSQQSQFYGVHAWARVYY